ncbi:MAG: hypothetical protein HXS54_11065 [Theionarchaea archaeon]|nr:hypothetical protein [Theionarchaea archaeon]
MIEWLLSDENPSIKLWALKDLLDTPEDDAQISHTRALIGQQQIVKKIFSLQNEEGYWGAPKKLWGYNNTVFQLLLLSELGVERNSLIKKAVEHVQKFQFTDGSFNYAKRKKQYATNDFCLTAIILKCLLLFGYTDSGVREALDFLVTSEGNWVCNYYPLEKEKVIPQTCYMGGIKVLAAFAKLPPSLVTADISNIIKKNTEVYLENRIYWYRKDKTGKRVKKPSWTKFAYPLFWQSDALEVLDVLTELKIRDERMNEALELVKSKQVDGKWILERTFPKPGVLEKVGQPSRWITLRALRVLKRAGYP